MISEVAGVAQAALLSIPTYEAFWQHKRTVAEITARKIPESLKATYESIRTMRMRAIGKTALTFANIGVLYGDDILLYNGYTRIKESINAGNTTKIAIAGAVISTAGAGIQGWVAHRNIENIDSTKVQQRNMLQEDDKDKNFLTRIEARYHKIRGHVGKIAATMYLGVPANALGNNFSHREVNAHAALWGITAPAFYEGVNIGLGAMNHVAAPAVLASAIISSRYINKACETTLLDEDTTEDVEFSDDTPSCQAEGE